MSVDANTRSLRYIVRINLYVAGAYAACFTQYYKKHLKTSTKLSYACGSTYVIQNVHCTT